MRAAIRNANAVREHGAASNPNDSNNAIVAELIESIKARIRAGECVTAADYSEVERLSYHAAIAAVQDQIPLQVSWKTKTESAVGDWRLRQKCYKLRKTDSRKEMQIDLPALKAQIVRLAIDGVIPFALADSLIQEGGLRHV